MISLSEPIVGEEEKAALWAVINSRWLTMGDEVIRFEDEFARLHDARGAVAVSSCTAGLHLALVANGIGSGDEVLVPSLTFVATSNSILYAGATPVFVDIESVLRPHMAIDLAAASITERTKAIIVVHYAGYLVDIPAWRALADRHNLILIEDVAHAPAVGAVGRFSDASAFSFFSNKNMTTAEGGMVMARSPEVLERVKRLRAHGMTANTLDRHRGHANSYDVTCLGFNYRLDELRAAIGRVQLGKLLGWNEQRRVIVQQYRSLFAARFPAIGIPFESDEPTTGHLFPILIPEGVNRDEVMNSLRADGIQSSIHYPPIHRFSYYRERFPGISLPRTEAYHARELSLPIHPLLSEADIETVVDAVGKWSGV